jgi:hypothetical protein
MSESMMMALYEPRGSGSKDLVAEAGAEAGSKLN